MSRRGQPPTSPSGLPPGVPSADNSIVDMEKFLCSFDGTAEDLAELADLYIRETEKSLGEIARALAAGDCEALRTQAHAGYGGSAQVGLRGVARVFRQMQQAGTEGALERGEALLAQARAELEKAREFLASYLARLRSEETR